MLCCCCSGFKKAQNAFDCFSIGDENEFTTGNSVFRKNRGRILKLITSYEGKKFHSLFHFALLPFQANECVFLQY